MFILAFTAISDFSFALLISQTHKLWKKRLWLILSVGVSLGFLFYFKYTYLFGRTLNNLLGTNIEVFDYLALASNQVFNTHFDVDKIILPVGISFYTFQSISYVVDVYWEKIKPTKNFLDYTFYLSFFPQLVAGPIVKAKLFLPQLEKKIKIDKKEMWAGFFLIILGLFKKAVLADYIALYNDLVFKNPANYNGFSNLMAVYGYTLQIYCDFSGYSDMAIGLGKIMGFDLGINFRLPYQSKNITIFWRRWHISLSSWLRDYLYIPLGGNRCGKIRMYINLMLTMLLGGLWHGASWKFVFWGGLHGIGLAVHKALKKPLDKIPDTPLVKFFSWFITFHFVIFLWIFFRADSFTTAWQVIEQIAFNMQWNYALSFVYARQTWVILLLIGFAMHAVPLSWQDKIKQKFIASPYLVKLLVFIFVVQLVIQFKSEDVQPFIYFQF